MKMLDVLHEADAAMSVALIGSDLSPQGRASLTAARAVVLDAIAEIAPDSGFAAAVREIREEHPNKVIVRVSDGGAEVEYAPWYIPVEIKDTAVIKNVADFKRAMVPGTHWTCTHRFIGDNPSEPKDLGERECVLNNTVGFAFKTESGASHCSWPKKTEFSIDGDTVVITKPGLCELRYTQVTK